MRTEQSAAREAKIIELRRHRISFQDIGTQVGLSGERCRQIFNEAIDRRPAENLAVLRAEETELADEAIANLLTIARNVNASHRDRIEAWKATQGWSESKRKIWGVDAPQKRELQVTDISAWEIELAGDIARRERENERLAAEANAKEQP